MQCETTKSNPFPSTNKAHFVTHSWLFSDPKLQVYPKAATNIVTAVYCKALIPGEKIPRASIEMHLEIDN